MRGAAARQSQLASHSCGRDWHVGGGGVGSEAEANSVGGQDGWQWRVLQRQHAQWQVVALRQRRVLG